MYFFKSSGSVLVQMGVLGSERFENKLLYFVCVINIIALHELFITFILLPILYFLSSGFSHDAVL